MKDEIVADLVVENQPNGKIYSLHVNGKLIPASRIDLNYNSDAWGCGLDLNYTLTVYDAFDIPGGVLTVKVNRINYTVQNDQQSQWKETLKSGVCPDCARGAVHVCILILREMNALMGKEEAKWINEIRGK